MYLSQKTLEINTFATKPILKEIHSIASHNYKEYQFMHWPSQKRILRFELNIPYKTFSVRLSFYDPSEWPGTPRLGFVLDNDDITNVNIPFWAVKPLSLLQCRKIFLYPSRPENIS